jgi:hypothetical protein
MELKINNKNAVKEKIRKGNQSIDVRGEKATFEAVVNKRVQTLDDLVQVAKIDLNEWIVERWLCNKWEVAAKIGQTDLKVQDLWQVKAWLKRNKPAIALRDIKEQLVKELKKYAPKYPKINYKRQSEPVLMEVNLFDFHFGKLTWGKETGENYDLKIAKKLFLDCVDRILSYANLFNVERFLFPIGNDFFNVNSSNQTTYSGTPQSEDDRWKKTFVEGWKLVSTAIDKLTSFAPVDVLIIPGNHDTESSFYMGEVLAAIYSNNENVSIDNSPPLRKYFRYGDNLIGFTHGKDEKIADLPLIMANERSIDFGITKYREWHLGDKHHKKEIKWIATEEIKGVTVRILRSLSTTDVWHYQKGYVGNIRAGEAFLWHKKKGLIANISVNY